MTDYTDDSLDHTRLQPPPLASIDYDTIRAARLAGLKARFEEMGIPWNVDRVKFNPAVIVEDEDAYREQLARQAVDDAANSLRLGFSVGAALDHIAQTYHRTARREIAPGVFESDQSYRIQAQLSSEALPLYGLVPGGYTWRVGRQFAAQVKDVRPINIGGGRIKLVVLGRDGDGTVPVETIVDIQRSFDGEDAEQSTDVVSVFAADIARFDARLVLKHRRGRLFEPLQAAAEKALIRLRDERHAISGAHTRSAIEAAANVDGVHEAILVNADGLPDAARDAAPWLVIASIDPEVIGG